MLNVASLFKVASTAKKIMTVYVSTVMLSSIGCCTCRVVLQWLSKINTVRYRCLETRRMLWQLQGASLAVEMHFLYDEGRLRDSVIGQYMVVELFY